MGWTSYHAEHYKRGTVDRKAECDAYFMDGLNKGHFMVLKSAMVGSVYYAAVQTLRRAKKNADGAYIMENGNYIYEPVPEQERETWAAVFLTQTDMKDYFNFYYKDMDETMWPYCYDCPNSILGLLSPTDNENANAWRQACRERNAQKATNRKNPDSLNNLPEGSVIEVACRYDMRSGHKAADIVRLTKYRIGHNFRTGRSSYAWCMGRYRWSAKLIGTEYKVIERGTEVA